MRLLLSIITTAAVVLVACGGDGGSDSTSTSPAAAPSATERSATATSPAPASSTAIGISSTPPGSDSDGRQPPGARSATDPDAMAIAQMALLTTEDFPAGWSAAPDDEDDDDFVFTGDCANWNQDDIPFEAELASADSLEFTGPKNQTLSTGASVIADAATAGDGFASAIAEIDRCGGQLVSETRRMIMDGWEGNGYDTTNATLDVSFEPHSFVELADESVVYRFDIQAELEGLRISATVDMLFLRHGRIIGMYSYFGSGQAIDEIEEERYARLFADRVAAAEGDS